MIQKIRKVNRHHYVAIMAGGIGSRFWPSSRTGSPKQFLDVLNTGKTLIRWTFERYAEFIPIENIYVVTSDEYTGIVSYQLPELNRENIVAEPSRKNTAACVLYMSCKLLQKDPDALLIVAPSDHLIPDNDTFRNITLRALEFAGDMPCLVTLGIKPTHPNTGYGYIQHEHKSVAEGVYKVKNFTEKPNLELANTFLASGDFLWNSGIFVWPAKTVFEAYETYQPEMVELFKGEKSNFNTDNEKEAIQRIYSRCKNISIDFAIMEKADNVYVIPSSFGWNDLGTWNSAYDFIEKDQHGNALAGEHIMIIDATKCMVSAKPGKLVVLQGLEHFIVVDTADVLLICQKEKEQSIKEYVAEVKRNIGEKYL
jgi:mannose-1-phosphate guanylyltransferase